MALAERGRAGAYSWRQRYHARAVTTRSRKQTRGVYAVDKCAVLLAPHIKAPAAPRAPRLAPVSLASLPAYPQNGFPAPPHTRQWLTPGKTPTRQRAVLRELLRRWLIDSASHARPNVAARVHPCTQNKKRPIRGHSRRGAAPAPRQASITDSPASTARRTARTRRAKRG